MRGDAFIARYGFLLTIGLVVSDVTSVVIAFMLAILLRNEILGPVSPSIFFEIIALSVLVSTVLLFSFNQYKHKRNLFDMDEFLAVAKSIVFTAFVIVFFTYISKSSIQYSRFIILLSFIIAFILIVISRCCIRETLGLLRKKGYNIRKAYVLGDSKASKLICHKINDSPHLGYKLTKSLDSCDTAFVCSNKQQYILDLIFSHPNIEFKIMPDVVQSVTEPAKFDEFVDIPLITVKKSSSRQGYFMMKRLFDVSASLSLLALTSPLFLFLAIVNPLSHKNVFFTHERLGLGLKEFRLYKFCTMKPGEKPVNEADYLFKSRNDPRITLLGKFLRRTCLDELPQLFNVLLGDMSLVGPRPHLKEELHFFEGWKKKRFDVKPGLTGLWQVSGRHELNSEKAAALDLYYINHMSPSLDLKIILKTIPAIIFSRGRW